MNNDRAGKPGSGGGWRIGVLVLVVAGLIAAGRFLPLKDWFDAALAWAGGLGYWGPGIVVALYVVACVLFLPGSVLTIGAGLIFGFWIGIVTVSLGATLGACAAFWVGRTVGRGWVAKKIAGNAKFAALDEAVGREGFKIVLLTRLSPVFPFNLLNFAFGLTRVNFRNYALASWIGMLPGTVMYVYIGSAARSLAEARNRPRTLGEEIFIWAGLAVTVVVAVLVARIARRALEQAAPSAVTAGKGDGRKAQKEVKNRE
jgi:uncharacterized membrane protein YdjX (TVP38/TMEM64 family)